MLVTKLRRILETAETINRDRAVLAMVGLVLLVGAVLRFHNLGNEGLDDDEAASWIQAKDSLLDLIRRTAHDNYPPLHNLALYAVIKLFGDSEWSLRPPSAIFGVANIGAVYWLATLTVGRTAGVIGAALLAISPFHLFYSQEARTYSLLALAATVYAATCFQYLRAPSVQRGAWVALTGLVLVYSHPYGALDWITIAVAFTAFVFPSTVLPPRMIFIWKASNAVVAAGFAPWALILAYRGYVIETKGFWIPVPFSSDIFNTMLDFLGGRLLGSVILVGVMLGVVGRLRREVVVLYVWTFAPVTIGLVVSTLSAPIFIWRYVIGSLPPLLLVSAFGWTKYVRDWRGVILSAAIIAIAGLTLLRFNSPYFEKEDWRAVASFLDERARPTDCVLLVPAFNAGGLSYFRRNSYCQWGATKLSDLPADMSASVVFGVFDSRRTAAYVDELRRRGWRDLDRTDFRGGVQVIAFSR